MSTRGGWPVPRWDWGPSKSGIALDGLFVNTWASPRHRVKWRGPVESVLDGVTATWLILNTPRYTDVSRMVSLELAVEELLRSGPGVNGFYVEPAAGVSPEARQGPLAPEQRPLWLITGRLLRGSLQPGRADHRDARRTQPLPPRRPPAGLRGGDFLEPALAGGRVLYTFNSKSPV